MATTLKKKKSAARIDQQILVDNIKALQPVTEITCYTHINLSEVCYLKPHLQFLLEKNISVSDFSTIYTLFF